MTRDRFTAVVVDDDDDWRAIFTEALHRSGSFEVVEAVADALAGVDAVARHQPDVTLLDLALPGLSGLEVIGPIREAAPATRLVVVTGFPGDRLGHAVQERGAVGFVEKGLSPRRTVEGVLAVAGVLDTVEEILASSRRTLAPELRSGSVARRFMEETLERWSCDSVLDVVNLLVTELVTNAVVHGGSEAEVSVVLTPEALRVEVGDQGEPMPVKRQAADFDTSGRGLALVEALSRRWGVEPTPDGKVIWFEVDRPDR